VKIELFAALLACKEMIEKRANKRKNVNIQANIVYNDEIYSGTVTNLSKQGAYIETGLGLPFKLKHKIFFYFKPKFIIFLNFNSECIKVFVKTRRWFKIDRTYNGLGVEVLNPPQDYFKLINM
jgi:hypothetical protein